MGFVLALFYLMVTYLGTGVVFGQLAKYHVEEIIAGLVFCASIPALMRTFVGKTVQTIALAGLAIAVAMSMLLGVKFYAHGALTAFEEFLPNAFAYFLVVLHCRTRMRIQIVVLLLFCVASFVIVNGVIQLQTVNPGQFKHALTSADEDDDLSFQDADPDIAIDTSQQAMYLMPQIGGDGIIWRLKGQNFISDPNDFGQLLVCLLPLTFIFWRPKQTLLNMAVVFPMVLVIGLGIYLTHSRGALLAIMGVVIVAFRRKIGVVPSVILGGGVFAAAMAMHATGGRDISADAGADRTALWGDGLGLLKAHPIFGAGFNQMAELIGKTAHNSIIVCAAELGFFGLFFWSLFLLPTVRDALAVASPTGLTDAVALPVDESPYAYLAPSTEKLDKAAIGNMGRLIFYSLVGFMISAMFLSRAFVMTFFLLGGMAEVVFQMALDRGMIAPRLPFGKAAYYSAILAILLVPGMYVIVRILNLGH
jgi:hypothetical protein